MATPNLSQRIAQSIGVRAYVLNVSTLAPQQIACYGKFTFIALRGGYPRPLAGVICSSCGEHRLGWP